MNAHPKRMPLLFPLLVLLFSFSAPLSAQEPTPPQDPRLQEAWQDLQEARARFKEAEQEYLDAEETAKNSPQSREARAARKKARKELERARKKAEKAERAYRAKEVAYRRRGPSFEEESELPRERPRRRPPEADAPPQTPIGAPLPQNTPTPTETPSEVGLPPTPTPPTETGPPTPDLSSFPRNWAGGWVNNTFGSRGSASAVISFNTAAQTFQIVLTLGGQVFGVGAPPPQTFSGSYSSAGAQITTSSPLFGNVTTTADAGGRITGSATGLANPDISRFDFSGTATRERVTINYTVVFAGGGGTAEGVLTLTPQR